MKKRIIYLSILLVTILLPTSVLAANTYQVYRPTDNYSAATSHATLEEAAIAATGVCVNDLAQTTQALCAASEVAGATWAPAFIVVAGDDTEISALTTDAVIIANGCSITITGPVTAYGAGTFGDVRINVTGGGKATITASRYPSYIGNANTFAFDTSESGSGVAVLTLDPDGFLYDESDSKSIATLIADLIGQRNSVWSGYEITGKVTLRQNLGLLGRDGLVIDSGAELVVPANISLDSRDLLAIAQTGKLTLETNSTLYNVGQIEVVGTIDGNGEILNGSRSTNGQVVNVGVGDILVASTGTINVNDSLNNAEGAGVRNEGTIKVARAAAITNSEAIVLLGEGTLVNNTPEDINVMKLNVESEDPVALVVPAAIDNPQTSDSILIIFAVATIALLSLATTIIYTKKIYS